MNTGISYSSQPPVKHAWLENVEDFDYQMEKEKARLNRFIGVKELNN